MTERQTLLAKTDLNALNKLKISKDKYLDNVEVSIELFVVSGVS